MADHSVYARGLRCRMPLLLAKRALLQAAGGDSVVVQATDPGSWRDFHAFAQLADEMMTAHRLSDQEFEYHFTKRTR